MDIPRRFTIFSRHEDEDIRNYLGIQGEGWAPGLYFFDEEQALEELRWLRDHTYQREFKLVCQPDPLDDEIPF